MDGASFSDIGFPIEILRELVLQDPSPSSLARWCRVGSHDLLALAGPMLYRVVALTRAQDVVPMLLRLVSASLSVFLCSAWPAEQLWCCWWWCRSGW